MSNDTPTPDALRHLANNLPRFEYAALAWDRVRTQFTGPVGKDSAEHVVDCIVSLRAENAVLSADNIVLTQSKDNWECACKANDAVVEKLKVENAALREQLKASKRNEAVCHCGDLVSQHHMGSGHSPVPMPEECDYAAELAALREDKARLDWLEKAGSLSKVYRASDRLVAETRGAGPFPAHTWRTAIDAARKDAP